MSSEPSMTGGGVWVNADPSEKAVASVIERLPEDVLACAADLRRDVRALAVAAKQALEDLREYRHRLRPVLPHHELVDCSDLLCALEEALGIDDGYQIATQLVDAWEGRSAAGEPLPEAIESLSSGPTVAQEQQ